MIYEWTGLIKFAIVIFIGFVNSIFIYRMFKKNKDRKKNLYYSIVVFMVLVFMVFYFFFSFKNKNTILSNSNEQGINQIVDQYPDEKNLLELKKDSINKKNEMLKKQDEDFKKDKEEADEYTKKILKELK